ncbi:hypothetical protein [Georgenia faecalis]|uniref:hypothetical protein n=1 Tax=Georgenia faecalis TaxID=2483799 RepID=UPI000FD990AC|nr:hypothetical protein [Georgenia faecalis]
MEVQGWVLLALAVVLLGYLVPHLVRSRQELAESRVEDRFSAELRVLTTAGPTPARVHHGEPVTRPYLHDPRRRTEAPAVNRHPDRSERPTDARRIAAARAARAAEISRRAAAARRRLILTVALLLAAAAAWVVVGLAGASWVLGAAPTVLLAAVLVLGRRAARTGAARDAADRAAMAELHAQLRSAPAARPALTGRPALPARPAAQPAVTAERAPARVTTPAEPAPAPISSVEAAAAEPSPVVEEAPVVADTVPAAAPSVEAPAAPAAPAVTAPVAEPAPVEAASVRRAASEPGAPAARTARTAPTSAAVRVPAEAQAPPSAPYRRASTYRWDADLEQTWTPVPVPMPTYTLKPPAPRRDVSASSVEAMPTAAAELAPRAEVSDVAAAPLAPAPVMTAALDVDAVLVRRRAVGA